MLGGRSTLGQPSSARALSPAFGTSGTECAYGVSRGHDVMDAIRSNGDQDMDPLSLFDFEL